MLSLPDFKYKQIIVHITHTHNEKLCFRSDNIVILDEEGEVKLQHTCHRIFALFIIGEISLTSILIKHCIQYHFPIILMNRNFKIVAKFNCETEGNTLLRQRQYLLSSTEKLDISKQLIQQKINNQINLLNMLRYKSKDDKNTISFLKKLDITQAEDSYELMGIEGTASKYFFKSYYHALKWRRREPRCKQDITNLLLDIGYTWLFQFIEAMLSLYGFDLYCGVLHTFFYQRKSLVCDIIEPFRCIIDNRVRKAHNLKQIREDDFFIKNHQYYLKYEAQTKYTSLFLKDILEHKTEIFKFCQSYYRWMSQQKDISDFPVFSILKDK